MSDVCIQFNLRCTLGLKNSDGLSHDTGCYIRVSKPGGRMVIGMVNKHSEWEKMYGKRGKDKKESIF